MKTTLNNLVNSSGALSTLVEMKLPAKLAYRLARLGKQVGDELELFNKQRVALLEKYGEKEGEQYRLKPETQEGFQAEYAELLGEEVELPDITVKVDEIPDSIRPADLMALDWLIKE